MGKQRKIRWADEVFFAAPTGDGGVEYRDAEGKMVWWSEATKTYRRRVSKLKLKYAASMVFLTVGCYWAGIRTPESATAGYIGILLLMAMVAFLTLFRMELNDLLFQVHVEATFRAQEFYQLARESATDPNPGNRPNGGARPGHAPR